MTQDHQGDLWPPDDWPVKLVIARPRCGYCTNRDSVIEGLLVFHEQECYVSACDRCWELVGVPGTGHMLVHAAERQRLPTRPQVIRYIDGQEWTTARRGDHQYVLLHKSSAPWMHLRVLAYIRRHGEGKWWSWPRGLHFYWKPGDGFMYWTLASQQVILNRQPEADDDATEVGLGHDRDHARQGHHAGTKGRRRAEAGGRGPRGPRPRNR